MAIRLTKTLSQQVLVFLVTLMGWVTETFVTNRLSLLSIRLKC